MLLTSGAATFVVTNPTDGRDELAAAVHLHQRAQRRPDRHPARLRRRASCCSSSSSSSSSSPGCWPVRAPASPSRSASFPEGLMNRTHPRLRRRASPPPARRLGGAAPARRVADRSRTAGAASAPRGLRHDRGHRLHLVADHRRPVDRRRRLQRHQGRLHRRRLLQGPQGLRAEQRRLRDLRDPLPGHRRDRAAPTPATAATTPTCRSSPAARRSPTSSRSATSRSRTCGSPARRSPRSSPARSPTGTTTRSPPTTTAAPSPTADHPGGALRRLGHDRPVHHLARQGLPVDLAAVLRQVRPHVVLPASKGTRRSASPAPTR